MAEAETTSRTRSRVRRVAVPLLALLVLLGTAHLAAHLLTGRYAWAWAVAWLESDIGDQHRFPAREVAAGLDVSPLRRGPAPEALTEPVNLGGVGRPFEDWYAVRRNLLRAACVNSTNAASSRISHPAPCPINETGGRKGCLEPHRGSIS